MSVVLEHYASLASEAIKEKLKELKANILNDDENDSREHNGEEEDKMEVDEDAALKTKLSSSLQCKEINTDILDTMVCKTAMPSSLALQPGFEKLDQLPNKLSKRQEKKQKRIERSKTKGKDWFHMQAAEQTEEKMNELKIIQMRGILDSKTFYKRTENRPGVLPKFFQSGTVIEAPTDYYSSRIPKKQRKKTLVDELLADVEFQKYRKRKYAEVASKTQGHKKFKKNKKSN